MPDPDVHRPIGSADALPVRPVPDAALQLAEEPAHAQHVLPSASDGRVVRQQAHVSRNLGHADPQGHRHSVEAEPANGAAAAEAGVDARSS